MNGELIKLLAKNIPITALVEKLKADEKAWKENTWRQDYVVQYERPISPQRDTEAVMFRWAPENTIESVRDSLNVIMNSNCVKMPEIVPILEKCIEAAGAIELGRVFVAKLRPGGFVIPHQDYGMYADHFERFHLVLTSDKGNEFFVEDHEGHKESAHMNPGEFFWFSHRDTHWAVNNSKSPRMHLIMDMVAPRYRRERAAISA